MLRYDGTPEVSAIQRTTAAGCVAMVELFYLFEAPGKGFRPARNAARGISWLPMPAHA